MAKETNITRNIMKAVSKVKTRIFRNNTGMGWAGKARHVSKNPSTVVVKYASPLHAGLCKGSSDLIGWTTREITPDDVGKKVAVFTALEVKAPGGRASKAQLNFIKQVRAAGGIAGLATGPGEAVDLIKKS